MKITKCCCCLSTRTGAYIIGICGIIRGILYLSYLILLMNAHEWKNEGKNSMPRGYCTAMKLRLQTIT